MSGTERTTWLFRNNVTLQMTPDWRFLGKLDHSFSDSSLGEFYAGGYTEAVFGYAYRPVHNDRLDALAKRGGVEELVRKRPEFREQREVSQTVHVVKGG